jgi:Ca2+-binding RTX toxin-like protein
MAAGSGRFIEVLENRKLLTIFINGTAGNDTIVVGYANEASFFGWYYQVSNVAPKIGLGITGPYESLYIDAGDGNDTVVMTGTYPIGFNIVTAGYPGGATLIGGFGDDRLFGGAGNDDMQGGSGRDTLVASLGSDTLSGGSGIDNADFTNSGSGTFSSDSYRFDLNINSNPVSFGYANGLSNPSITDTITTTVENIDTGSGNDRVIGSDRPNYITTGNGNDYADGFIGDDTINGGSGNDEIYGGDGNDVLQGYGGTDTLYGNGGIDRFAVQDGVLDYVNGGAEADVWDSSDLIDRQNAVNF